MEQLKTFEFAVFHAHTFVELAQRFPDPDVNTEHFHFIFCSVVDSKHAKSECRVERAWEGWWEGVHERWNNWASERKLTLLFALAVNNQQLKSERLCRVHMLTVDFESRLESSAQCSYYQKLIKFVHILCPQTCTPQRMRPRHGKDKKTKAKTLNERRSGGDWRR